MTLQIELAGGGPPDETNLGDAAVAAKALLDNSWYPWGFHFDQSATVGAAFPYTLAPPGPGFVHEWQVVISLGNPVSALGQEDTFVHTKIPYGSVQFQHPLEGDPEWHIRLGPNMKIGTERWYDTIGYLLGAALYMERIRSKDITRLIRWIDIPDPLEPEAAVEPNRYYVSQAFKNTFFPPGWRRGGGTPGEVVAVGQQMDVSSRLLLVAMMVGLVEAPDGNGSFTNPSTGAEDSVGWRQERLSIYGPSAYVVADSARRFFEEATAADHGQSLGDLAQDVQGSAFPERYAEVEDEARALLAKVLSGALNHLDGFRLKEAKFEKFVDLFHCEVPCMPRWPEFWVKAGGAGRSYYRGAWEKDMGEGGVVQAPHSGWLQTGLPMWMGQSTWRGLHVPEDANWVDYRGDYRDNPGFKAERGGPTLSVGTGSLELGDVVGADFKKMDVETSPEDGQEPDPDPGEDADAADEREEREIERRLLPGWGGQAIYREAAVSLTSGSGGGSGGALQGLLDQLHGILQNVAQIIEAALGVLIGGDESRNLLDEIYIVFPFPTQRAYSFPDAPTGSLEFLYNWQSFVQPAPAIYKKPQAPPNPFWLEGAGAVASTVRNIFLAKGHRIVHVPLPNTDGMQHLWEGGTRAINARISSVAATAEEWAHGAAGLGARLGWYPDYFPNAIWAWGHPSMARGRQLQLFDRFGRRIRMRAEGGAPSGEDPGEESGGGTQGGAPSRVAAFPFMTSFEMDLCSPPGYVHALMQPLDGVDAQGNGLVEDGGMRQHPAWPLCIREMGAWREVGPVARKDNFWRDKTGTGGYGYYPDAYPEMFTDWLELSIIKDVVADTKEIKDALADGKTDHLLTSFKRYSDWRVIAERPPMLSNLYATAVAGWRPKYDGVPERRPELYRNGPFPWWRFSLKCEPRAESGALHYYWNSTVDPGEVVWESEGAPTAADGLPGPGPPDPIRDGPYMGHRAARWRFRDSPMPPWPLHPLTGRARVPSEAHSTPSAGQARRKTNRPYFPGSIGP